MVEGQLRRGRSGWDDNRRTVEGVITGIIATRRTGATTGLAYHRVDGKLSRVRVPSGQRGIKMEEPGGRFARILPVEQASEISLACLRPAIFPALPVL